MSLTKFMPGESNVEPEFVVPELADLNVGTMDAGHRRLLDKLRSKGYKLGSVKPINKKRYWIILGKPKNILIIYKREVFYNFGSQFRHLGFKGVGDSINCDDLKEAIRCGVKEIYTIFPNGAVYVIEVEEFLNKSVRWTNKEGKNVRSISIHEYTRSMTL